MGKIKSGGVNMKKYFKTKKESKENSTMYIPDLPQDAFEMVNKYGTYEIQDTADTENEYPFIAQGFNPKIIETDLENPR